MSVYTINGHEIEYDAMDLENLELYYSESKRLIENSTPADGEDLFLVFKNQCNAVLDFFDTVVGEGTSETIFGGSMNVKEILTAYKEFSAAVNQEVIGVTGILKNTANANAPTHDNRAARRAAERLKRM